MKNVFQTKPVVNLFNGEMIFGKTHYKLLSGLAFVVILRSGRLFITRTIIAECKRRTKRS